MYRLAIGARVKQYKRLGNAFNAFWAYYNKTPRALLPNMCIYSLETNSIVIEYTQSGGIKF